MLSRAREHICFDLIATFFDLHAWNTIKATNKPEHHLKGGGAAIVSRDLGLLSAHLSSQTGQLYSLLKKRGRKR